jgi:glucose-1-phosphate adenylyltransferase
MDYEDLANRHWDSGADITIAVQPIREEDASRFGLLKTDKDEKILDFAEKPEDEKVLKAFVSRDDKARPYLGSMGIYMFNTDVLIELLSEEADTDFGGEVIPRAIEDRKVVGYDFEGYWEDIGTIRSFYETNLSLTRPDSPFNFTDPTAPIYSRPRFLPGSTVFGGQLENVLLADGCCVGRSNINDAVIGLRSQVADETIIKSSIIMGADYYDTDQSIALNGGIPMGIGEGSHIEGAIIDKDVCIGQDVIIRPFPPGTEIEEEQWAVRDGIVVVMKSAVLPSGTYIGPGE